MTTLMDEKKKVLALIEELNPDSQYLTDDPDIRAKIHYVINQIQFELARIKKIPKYVKIAVTKGQMLGFEEIAEAVGAEVYQLGTVGGVDHDIKANGTLLKILESGTAEIDCYIYPKEINEQTPDDHEFELSQDALEIMPYGVAADLLKSDVSTEYGSIYSTRYENMLNRLDPRNAMPSIRVEGGFDI